MFHTPSSRPPPNRTHTSNLNTRRGFFPNKNQHTTRTENNSKDIYVSRQLSVAKSNNNNIKNVAGADARLKEETMSILESLEQSALMISCEKFQRAVEQVYGQIWAKFLELQVKFATCQKAFNLVELSLTKKAKQIHGLNREKQAAQIRNDNIQNQLKLLKKQYEMSIINLKNSQLSSGIRSLKKYIDQIQQKSLSGQWCQSCQLNLQNTLSKNFKLLNKGGKDSSQNLRILGQILAVILNKQEGMSVSVSQYAQKKILENIRLKAQISKLTIQLEIRGGRNPMNALS